MDNETEPVVEGQVIAFIKWMFKIYYNKFIYLFQPLLIFTLKKQTVAKQWLKTFTDYVQSVHTQIAHNKIDCIHR